MTKEYHPLVPNDEGFEKYPTKEPEDSHGAAWICFAILGTGILLPWNAFINASDYFGTVFYFFPAFIFFLSLAYNYSSNLCLGLSIKVMPRFSFGSRLVIAFSIDLVVLLIIPFLNTIAHDAHLAMILTFVGVFITGIATSILFGTVFGLAAIFPPRYSTAVMSGNGVAGVLSSLLRIITKASVPNTPSGQQTSGILFFALGASVMLICIVSYFVLIRLPIAQYYSKSATKTEVTETDRLINVAGWRSEEVQPVSVRIVFKKVWKEALTVWAVFFSTLALFPGITSLIAPNSHSIDADWFGIVLVAIFTFGDFIGRTLPKWFVIFSPRTLWIPTAIRFVFFVLFPLCIKPLVFHIDAVVYIFMAVFALTNGYCGTLAMMFGPASADAHEKEVAGIIMSFALGIGILCGVHFALLILYLLTGSIGVNL